MRKSLGIAASGAVMVGIVVLGLAAYAGAGGGPTEEKGASNRLASTKQGDAKVPDGTPAEILAFMEKTLTLKAEEDVPDDAKESMANAMRLILAGAEKVLAHPKVTDEERTEAIKFKISILYQGSQIGLENYASKLEKLAKELADADRKSDLAPLANYLSIKAKFEGDSGLGPQALPSIEAFLKTFPGNDAAVALLEEVGTVAERMDDPKSAVKAYELIAKHFPEQSIADAIPGIVRRLELVGKPMALEGIGMSGSPVNIASMKGKVVLVDFWATWCGPCMAELPALKAAYAKYHDRGFEIIGVPLDDDRDALEQFLTEAKLPWTQIDPHAKSADPSKEPIAQQYGILAIPAMILVDGSGKVVSTTLRGEDLASSLDALLAPSSQNNSVSLPAK